jgi:membrane-bound lytic murein transglycosylase B
MPIFTSIIKYIKRLMLTALVVSYSCAISAQTAQTWQSFIAKVKQEAIQQGVDSTLLEQIFFHMTPDAKVLQLDKQQAPKSSSQPITYNFAVIKDPARIQAGIKYYYSHQAMLLAIGKQYGVDPFIILAIWGKESHYGQYQGRFPIIKSLATLAFDSRRAAFFKAELLQALHIINDKQVDEQHFKGSWAGASGNPQFMPSSWNQYAIDYDKDGKRDIWYNTGDTLASIANYLVKNGWQSNENWGLSAKLTKPLTADYFGLQVVKRLAAWQALGVQVSAKLDPNWTASLLKSKDNSTYLVFNNFRVIMRYNHSNSYAAGVGLLADSIAQAVTPRH